VLWTWSRLHAAVVALELPTDQYVVGLAGAMLANESVAGTAEVELLATDVLCDELAREGWRRRTDGGLGSPSEPGLVVRGGDAGGAYLAAIDALIADAWHQDGIAVVSMLQVDRAAVDAFLAAAETETDTETWTWPRLSATVRALELPRTDYVVGLAGALLANESVAEVDDVELLVTRPLYDDLAQRDWPSGTGGVLLCPTQDALSARTDDVGDTYLLTVADLAADPWHRDGVPLVSMLQVRPGAAEAALRRGR